MFNIIWRKLRFSAYLSTYTTKEIDVIVLLLKNHNNNNLKTIFCDYTILFHFSASYCLYIYYVIGLFIINK